MRRVSDIILGDLAMLMALGFFAMLVFLLPWINPPTESDTISPPGNLIITVSWPPSDYDVDLWVKGPGEMRPVGYSNQSGKLFNLLRDDLGRPDEELNFENAFSRGLPDGEYIINLHCYKCYGISKAKPLPVRVDVRLKRDGWSARPLAQTTVTLTAQGEERTAMRFFIRNGEFDPNSLHNAPIRLRT